MKKLIILISLVFAISGVLFADISDYYEFVAGTTTYTEITGTAQTAAQGDDVISGAIDIGFTFPYGDNTYTEIKIASNGYITLGTGPGSTLTNNLTSTTYCPVVAPLWDDLHTGRVADATYPQTSSVQTLLQGTAPNRTFTVQYKYAYWRYSVTDSWVNFQVILHENGNIDLVHGPNANTSPGAATASIGINMLPGGSTNFWSVTPIANTVSNVTENNSIAAYIPPNTKYSFNVPVGLPNDLAAMSITGNANPSVGTQYIYTVNVRNRGLNPQTTYTVKLMSGTTELATVNGTAIQPGEILPFDLSWTPTVTGAMQLHGKVVLAGDENTLNDETGFLDINVQPAGTQMVIIGDGTSAASYPFYSNYGYVRDASIYTAAEIGLQGMITGIQWDCAVQYGHSVPYRILMKTTTDTAMLVEPWDVTLTGAQLCAEGTVTFDSVGWEYIPFTIPFVYTGDNLVVMVEANYGGAGTTSSQTFRYTTSTTGSHHYIYADNAPPTTNGYLNANRPNIGITLSSLGNEPAFAVNPNSWDYGQTFVNLDHEKTFTIINIGGGTTPLIINNIAIGGDPYFSIQNLPTLPLSLNSFESATFTATYSPNAVGNHTATIVITDNLTRTEHPVGLTGSCIDPTIYTSPYFQNFDAETTPNLPIDWSLYADAPGTVTTYTTTPYTAPNSVRIYNSTSPSGPYLISPPISPTLPLVAMRTKFWARGGSSTTVLSVGAMTTPLDPATYTEIMNIPLTTTWTEYVVGYQTYPGTGQFMAFKHGNAANSQSVYIDDVMIEMIPEHDLSALGISGSVSPSVNTPSNYSVTIRNDGTNPESTYQVKLFKEGDIEVSSVPGPTIAAGTTTEVVIPWTPTTTEETYIYGKVVLAGDENSLNNETQPLNVTVFPEGTLMITIGTGTSTQRYPMGSLYGYERSASMYTAAELIQPGLITGIQFDASTQFGNVVPYRVLMKNTTETAFVTEPWATTITDAQVCADDVITFDQTGWIFIPFTNPFVYSGDNLAVLIETNYGGTGTTSSQYFRYTTSTTASHHYMYQENTAPTSNGYLSASRPNIGVAFQMGGMGSLGGTVSSGGNPIDGATVTIVGTVFSQNTNATGSYNFPFVEPETYQVTCTKLGYMDQTQTAVITADQATTLNFVMIPAPQVLVTGHVVGSDAPTVGLEGATVNLAGVLDYTGTTNASGDFTITNVLAGNTYNYSIVIEGYQISTGSITLAGTNYNMGTIILNELATPAVAVNATLNLAETAVDLYWSPPGAASPYYQNDFELDNGGWVPSSNWTNPLGDWEWSDSYDVTEYVVGGYPTSEVPPPTAHSGDGLWGTIINAPYTNSGGFSYLTHTFDFTGYTDTVMRFWSWQNLFGNFDYAQVSVNGNLVWGPTTAVNNLWENVVIDLTAYDGQANVVIQLEEWATTVVNYAGWYVDDFYIGPAAGFTGGGREAVTGLTPLNRNLDRSLEGYKVWRLLQGQETNEASWTQLTANTITDTTYVDNGWLALPDGEYRWAVKSAYTNNVLAAPSFSNMIMKRPNDLSASTITGTSTPSVGQAFNYTVNISNTGTDAQTAGSYTVKIMSGTTELASVPGPAINPDESLDVIVPWTPLADGNATIFGKVVLSTDTLPTNDETPPISVFVHPVGTMMVYIGEGTSTQNYPFYTYYGYTRDASIYTAAELGVPGLITGIQWDVATQAGNTIPYRILMKMTTQTALVAQPWATTIADAQLCAEGTITINQLGWAFIPLTTPFTYTGDNLVVMVESNYGGAGTTTYQACRYTTSTTASHHYMYADSNPPTTNGYVNASRPNIAVSMTSIGTDPMFNVSPVSFDFGQSFINVTRDKTIRVTNIGGGTVPLVINSITIGGSPFFTLENLPTLPASLNSFQSLDITARYLPTAVGDHVATIVITDNLTRSYTFRTNGSQRDGVRTQHPVDLSAECIDPTIYTSPYAQSFDAVATPILPIDWSYLAVAPGTVTTYTTTPHSAPNSVRIYNSTTPSGPYLISPPIANTLPLVTMRVKFWGRGGSATTVLSVGGISDPYNADTYEEVMNIPLTTTWTEYIVGFQTYSGLGQFMAFKHGNAANSQSVYIDDVIIEVTPDNDLAALSISGNSTPTVNMTTNYSVTVFNWGVNPQTDYLVKLFTEGDVEIGSVAGTAISPGLSVDITVPWTPTVEGPTYIYGKVVLTGDQNDLNDQTNNMNVTVFPPGLVVITIGDGGTLANYSPVNMYYRNSLYEGLYFQNEMNFVGLITGVAFYNNFVTNLPQMPTKIWLGTTTQTDLSAGYIPSTSMTLVFDGLVDYPSGENTVTIGFPEAFLYLQDNLVMMVQRPMDTGYYSTSDRFQHQTIGTNRARRVASDATTYDPANPPAGTLTGQFPKTSLLVIPGGVGHLNGTVLGAGNIPLENATVQIVGGGQATTNALGEYSIINIIAETYQVTASRHGYIDQTLTVVIPEDSTVVQNFTLTQMPTVNVTGTAVGSDAPTVGLPGATINLTGYEEYSATANAQGEFTIPGVYTNQTYTYYISALGYQENTGTMNIGSVDFDMGNMVLPEIAYTPRSVTAEQNTPPTSVAVNWQAPDPNAVDITAGFEDALFPPAEWTQQITNNGPANTLGVLPTWCRFGTIVNGTTTIAPQEGAWQAGFWWDYNHQDEWLITPQFNCPQGATLSFWTYAYYGSLNNDHYYVKISSNNGTTWTSLWDATALTGGWNNYQNAVNIDLSAFAGQQVKIAWHADDPNSSSDGMWYNWFIDNVVIGSSTTTIRFAENAMTTRSGSAERSMPSVSVGLLPMSKNNEKEPLADDNKSSLAFDVQHPHHNSRMIEGYKVWRLVQGQELNETTWVLLTPNMITDLTVTDNGWATVDAGTYKWAVKAIYTNDVQSLGAFSNPVVKVPTPTGTLVGVVRNSSNIPILGAVITAGNYTTTSMANGSYNMAVAAGTYAVTCTATGYEDMTNNNVIITVGQTTISNFTMTTGIEEEVQIVRTELKGNYPNPFNPETIISYDIKVKTPVRIEIYNTKGQLVRTLVNEWIDKGHHQISWNGKDDNGHSVASGVYQYRMQAGEYVANRRMMLLK